MSIATIERGVSVTAALLDSPMGYDSGAACWQTC